MNNLRKMYRWVPSLYLMQSLPYALVTGISPIFYRNFNVSNINIALFTSLFAIPWLFKPLFAPALEALSSKRKITLFMQFLLAGLFLLLASSLFFKDFLYVSGIVFFCCALASAMHDISSDGFYIVSLNDQAQAHFIGIRTMFYQLGKLACQGGLIFIVGYLLLYWSKEKTWQYTLILLAMVTLLIAIYHHKILPAVELGENSLVKNNFLLSFKQVLAEFLHLPYLTLSVLFVLIYNIPEAQLMKIVPLFLLDNINHYGLGLSIRDVGVIYGGIGTIGVILGVNIAGFLLVKKTIKQCLVPIAIFAAMTNVGYLVLIIFNIHSMLLLSFFIVLAQLGFGISNGVYMLNLLQVFTKGSFPMSMYAISTALMGLSITLGGATSGYLQVTLGYTGFFSWIVISSFVVVIFSLHYVRKVYQE